jgi:molybdopterin-binding protein
MASHRDDNRSGTMKLSARNQFKGKVVEVKKGATTSHVRIDIGGGNIVTASITNDSVDELGLASGKTAYAVVKASSVMVAVE